MTNWRPSFIETTRLYLRPLELGDAEAIFAYANDMEVAKWTTWHPHENIEDSIAYLHNAVFPNYAKEIPDPWGITLKENPEMVIGTISLTPRTPDRKIYELGYALSQVFWSAGIMTESTLAILSHAFEKLHAYRVTAKCLPDNTACRTVLTRTGFKSEGTTRKGSLLKGHYVDTNLFAILDTDWYAVHPDQKAS